MLKLLKARKALIQLVLFFLACRISVWKEASARCGQIFRPAPASAQPIFTQIRTHSFMLLLGGKCLMHRVDKLLKYLVLCGYDFYTACVKRLWIIRLTPHFRRNIGCVLSAQLADEIAHFDLEQRILSHFALDGIKRRHYGGMISAEQLTDRGKRQIGQLSDYVDRAVADESYLFLSVFCP